MLDKIFVYLTDQSGGVAYLIIFGILVLCGIGFPVPEDVPLIATGYLIWDETLTWLPAILVVLVGVLVGDTILFFLGRKMGLRILETEKAQTLFTPEKVRRTRAYFRKYGDKIIFFARFVAGFRSMAFFMSGAMKMEYRRFILLDSAAAAISVPLWVAIGYGMGYYLGDEISQILRSVKHLKYAITSVILVIAILVIVRSIIKYERAKTEKNGRRT